MHNQEDKQNVALLAIPIILSMVLGLPSDFDSFSYEKDESRYEERRIQLNADTSDEVHPGASMSGQTQEVTTTNNRFENELALAIEANDFKSFTEVAAAAPFGELITPEAFAELVRQYNKQVKVYTS